MANAIRGEVPLNLSDGRTFTLIMDMEALVEAESAYGKPLQKMMADAAQGFVGASRALLYGALRAKHPDVTLRDASAIFMTDADAAGEALTEAVEKGFPDAAKSAEGKVSRPRTKTSGGSGAKRA
jgi:hypothetical protein